MSADRPSLPAAGLRVRFPAGIAQPSRVRLSGAPPAAAEPAEPHPSVEPAPPAAPAPAPPAPDFSALHARLDLLFTRLDEETARARASFDDALADLEPALLRLALAIAAKVVRREVASGGFDLAGGVREALSKVARGLGGHESRRIRVRAAPADAALLREVLAGSAHGADRATIEEDAAVQPGGCLVDCDLRRVVVDAEHELERVREALLSDGGGAHG